MATKRAQEGYTYQQERGFDVAQDIAKNDAVGEFTNMGVGFGTMAGVGGAVGGMVGGMMNDAVQSASQPFEANVTTHNCAKCGKPLPTDAKFCFECGEKVVNKGTVICPECGKEITQGKFCPECWHKFTPNICPKCGNTLSENAKFCSECGEKL